MTSVVGIADGKTVWIGADTCYSDKDSRGQSAHPKVFFKEVITGHDVYGSYYTSKTERLLFGCCGYFRMFQLLEYGWNLPDIGSLAVEEWLTVPFARSLRELFKDNGFIKSKDGVDEFPEGAFLMGFRGKLYHIEENFQFIESAHQEDACGSGSKFALGSLYTSRSLPWSSEQRIRIALNASLTNPFVSAPFDIWELKNGD